MPSRTSSPDDIGGRRQPREGHSHLASRAGLPLPRAEQRRARHRPVHRLAALARVGRHLRARCSRMRCRSVRWRGHRYGHVRRRDVRSDVAVNRCIKLPRATFVPADAVERLQRKFTEAKSSVERDRFWALVQKNKQAALAASAVSIGRARAGGFGAADAADPFEAMPVG